MAAAQVFAAQPDIGMAGPSLWGSAQPASSAGYPSSSGLFLPATLSAPSVADLSGSSGMASGSISSASAPAAPSLAALQRPARRRGCMHCITCSGLRHHCHSTTVRSSESPAAEWWPGGIHSPSIYYHLRARQLRYAAKHPERAGAVWRPAAGTRNQPSALLSRRGQAPLPLQVPAVYTNVSQSDGGVQYLGERVVPLVPPVAVPAGPHRPPPPAPKRGIDPPLRPARATWSHPYLAASDDDENSTAVLGSRRSSCASTAAAAFNVDPKRRCTQPQPHVITGATPTPTPGHFIVSRGSPARSQAASFSSMRGSSSSSMTGVLTPPQACGAPLSALSDVSLAPMSTGSAGDPWLPMINTSTAGTASAAWESPVLLLNRSAPVAESDPTMEQYYARQYNIKQEQAFPCHQVIEIGAGHGVVSPPPPTEAPSGWTSMLMSLAGSLKRTLSP